MNPTESIIRHGDLALPDGARLHVSKGIGPRRLTSACLLDRFRPADGVAGLAGPGALVLAAMAESGLAHVYQTAGGGMALKLQLRRWRRL